MDDDKLKELFSNFEPELSSSLQFMAKLQKNMEAVEIVRQYNLSQKRRNRQAVVIAALSGFVMGVILTLLYPLIADRLSTFSISVPHVVNSLIIDCSYAVWVIIAGACVLTSLNVYELSLSRLTSKKIPARQPRAISD